ncbi:DNA cytosine methyltransferase [Congregibacter litoralis]|uniref:DNA (cytosine-5-)-methyltransferase n=1 Tax=Congregibacter litoralis KT71 TaxID=314285 RepID=A4AD34_9GAMM|nr:DNA cytosine methyltransferase [Congregibacter litoralis]EAQ96087.2 DNA-methyltransferase (dcm) [Congregibacter litoralis KT71]
MKIAKSNLSFNSFFAGIGGFDLALERHGFQPQMHCEINAYCQKILKKNWPNTALEKDITTLGPASIPDANLWCGGFPCQDVSVARGSKPRHGLKGKNSGLFFPFAELIEKKKPRVLLIENVLGLLSSHNGQDFRIVLETLSSMGYSISWRVMNSRYFGSPQSRPRVFICAFHDNARAAVSTLYENAVGSKPANQRAGFLNSSECTVTGAKVAEVAYCLAATSGRHTGTDWSRTYVSYDSDVRRLTPVECEGLQGFPPGWTELSKTEAIDVADMDTPRYQALGNAVSVPVASWIGKRLKTELQRRTRPDITDPTVEFADFKASRTRHMKLSDLHMSTKANGSYLKWQSGGLVIGDDCWDIPAPQAPSQPIHKKLIDVIEKRHPETKYYLSPNAAAGILRRVNSQNRTLFEPMHSALERLIDKSSV